MEATKMEATKELLETYVKDVCVENRNLVIIAFDEMNSSQYEEAGEHFDQLYVRDPGDFMSYFFRAYCKSHCGKKIDAYANALKLTAAFEFAGKKAIAAKNDLEVNLLLLLTKYKDGMANLESNAVQDRYMISETLSATIASFTKNNMQIVKEYPGTKRFICSFLDRHSFSNRKYFEGLLIELDESYKLKFDEEKKIARQRDEKEFKTKKIIISAIILIVLLGIVLWLSFNL